MGEPRNRRARRDVLGVFREALGTAWRADRRGTVVAGVLQGLGALSALGVVAASKLALDALLAPDPSVGPALIGALVLLAGAAALAAVSTVLQSQHQRVVSERVMQRLWAALLRVCEQVDLATWESTEFMDRLARVRDNALSRPSAVMSAIFGAAGAVLTLVSLVVVLVVIHPLLVPVLLLAGIPTLAFSRAASRTEFRFASVANPVQRRRVYLKLLLTSRPYAAEIRAFQSGDHLLARHDDDDRGYLRLLVRQARVRQIIGLGSALTAAAALAITLVLIVVLVDTGRITLAEAGAAAIAARLLASTLSSVFSAIGTIVEAGPFLIDMRTFLDRDDDTVPASGTRRPEGRDLRHELTLQGVGYSYPGSTAPAVVDVDLTIPQGSVVAVVGENGSGKTTLAKIVAGLYGPDHGTVSWDGEAALDRARLRASVAVLFQDYVRYYMTAAENIAIADTSRPADRARVEQAAQRAHIDGAIGVLPEGYDTALGVELVEGADLSGGQWQRIALARVLYRDAAMVVLDEPTAAMDPRAEHDLFSDVRRMLDGRSALLISHRYSSVRLADHIYVMHHGRVVEHGTHDELVELGGRYAELYRLQAAAYLS